MGIKNLLSVKFNNKTINDLGELLEWKSMNGKKVIVDAMNIIYSSISVSHGSFNLTDKDGNTTKHIAIIIRKILKYKKNGIEQLWIFDNKETIPLKLKEQEKRRETRVVNITSDIINEVKELLNLSGIDYITAPPNVEAEMYAAFLSRTHYVDYVITNDMDAIIVGGNVIFDKVKTVKHIGTLLKYDDILRNVDVSANELLDIGICLGTDFNTKIKGIGPATVIKKIKTNSVQWTDETTLAKEYFIKMMDNKYISSLNVEYHQSNKDISALSKFLVDKNFNVSRYPIDTL